MPTLGSLFTGCGGLDLGLEHGAGLRTVWQCQYDPDSRDQPCDEILERHWPGVANLGNIAAVDWSGVEPVDVLAGGFPCQDVSHAGLRAGVAHGTRSGLWFEFARAVRALRPRIVVVENVPGLLTAGFGLVMADLAEAGYDAAWVCLRAADVGAPHGRERVFVVATDAERLRVDADGRVRRGGSGEPDGSPLAALSAGSEVARAADALADGPAAPDAASGGRPTRPGLRAPGASSGDARIGRRRPDDDGREATADAPGERRDGRTLREESDAERRTEAERSESDPDAGDGGVDAWGAYGPAVRRWEHVLGRPAPAPTDGRGRLNADFVEWMLGYPAGWTADVKRTARLKMLGNSVQVQCAEIVGLAVAELLAA